MPPPHPSTPSVLALRAAGVASRQIARCRAQGEELLCGTRDVANESEQRFREVRGRCGWTKKSFSPRGRCRHDANANLWPLQQERTAPIEAPRLISARLRRAPSFINAARQRRTKKVAETEFLIDSVPDDRAWLDDTPGCRMLFGARAALLRGVPS